MNVGTIIILLVIIMIYINNLPKVNFSNPGGGGLTRQDALLIAPSKIEGVGLFATKNYSPNTKIFRVIEDKVVTRTGSLINHSWTPNTKLVKVGSNETYDIVAKHPIQNGTELTVDYRDTPDFIKKPDPNWK